MVNNEIKKKYVWRYWLGELAISLGREMIEKGIVNSTLNTASKNVFRWQKKFNYIEFKKANKKEINSIKRKNIIGEVPKKKSEIYELIKKKKEIMSVRFLCKKMNVSRQGYYSWLKRNYNNPSDKIKIETHKYDKELLKMVEASFYENRKVFGFRRIHIHLKQNYGIYKNVKTIKRYYDYLGFRAIIRQPRKNRELKNTKFYKENLINREFKADQPNKKWFSDITYVPLKNSQFGFLSVIVDGYNNKIIDQKFSKYNDSKLVMDNLKSAISKTKDIKDLIFHTDHGIQYTSKVFQNYIDEGKITHSMSRIGNSLDNRPAEYLFSILKQEYLGETFLENFENVKERIHFAKNHYNYFRFQGCLNNLTPMRF